MSLHALKHHTPYRSQNCTLKLNQVIYSYSDLAKKKFPVQEKKLPLSIESFTLLLWQFYLGVFIDGSNLGSQKRFPIVIPYCHKVHAIESNLIPLNSTPNENLETIALHN